MNGLEAIKIASERKCKFKSPLVVGRWDVANDKTWYTTEMLLREGWEVEPEKPREMWACGGCSKGPCHFTNKEQFRCEFHVGPENPKKIERLSAALTILNRDKINEIIDRINEL